jgi:Zn finger protein HypA/HybF involved in hydrogenase expression
MPIYTIVCDQCEEKRTGRGTDDDVTPVRERCPSCGSAEYTVPAQNGGKDS